MGILSLDYIVVNKMIRLKKAGMVVDADSFTYSKKKKVLILTEIFKQPKYMNKYTVLYSVH